MYGNYVKVHQPGAALFRPFQIKYNLMSRPCKRHYTIMIVCKAARKLGEFKSNLNLKTDLFVCSVSHKLTNSRSLCNCFIFNKSEQN